MFQLVCYIPIRVTFQLEDHISSSSYWLDCWSSMVQEKLENERTYFCFPRLLKIARKVMKCQSNAMSSNCQIIDHQYIQTKRETQGKVEKGKVALARL